MIDEVWVLTGSGSGSGNGSAYQTSHALNSAGSASIQGSSASGTETEDWSTSSNYGYGYTSKLGPNASAWSLVSGPGSGGGSANYGYHASGSGTYSFVFDDGAGLVEGTNSYSEDETWQYGYTQDSAVVDGAWVTNESGSGTSLKSSHSEYSGSGAYSSSSSYGPLGPADGYQHESSNTASGSFEEYGHTSQSADSTFSWTNGDWTETKHDSADSASHWHYGTANSTVMTTSVGSAYSGSNPGTGSMHRDSSFDWVSDAASSSSGTQTFRGGTDRSHIRRGSTNSIKPTTDVDKRRPFSCLLAPQFNRHPQLHLSSADWVCQAMSA